MQKQSIRLIFTAYFFSLLGDSLFRIAFPIFIYQLTQDPLYTSLAYAVEFLPYLLIMPFMGNLVDTSSKKKLLLLTDSLSFVFMAALAVTSYFVATAAESQSITPLLIAPLYILLFIVVSFDSVNHPAFHAYIPKLLDSSLLPKVNSGMGVMRNILSVLGAIVGGVLVSFVGAGAVLWMNAVSFLLSFCFIALLQRDVMERTVRSKTPQERTVIAMLKASWQTPWNHLKESVRYTFSNIVSRFFTIFHFFANLANGLVAGGLIFFLSDILKLSSAGVGLVIGLSGLGAVLGSVTAPYLMKKWKNGSLFLTVAFLVSAALGSFALASSIVLAIMSYFFFKFFLAIIVVLTFTIRQQTIPQENLGKVITISRPVSFVPIPVSAMISGYILGLYGSIVPLAIAAGVIGASTALIGLRSKFIRLANDLT